MSYIIKESNFNLVKKDLDIEIEHYNKSEINSLLNVQLQKIDTNTINITANTDAIIALTNTEAADKAALQAEIDTNVSNITANADAITALTNTEAADKSELQGNIDTNATNIAINATAISDLSSTEAADKAALQTQITTNATNISTNAADIADLQGLIVDITVGVVTKPVVYGSTQIKYNTTYTLTCGESKTSFKDHGAYIDHYEWILPDGTHVNGTSVSGTTPDINHIGESELYKCRAIDTLGNESAYRNYNVTVGSNTYPTIDSITWDTNDQQDVTTYLMTINASDADNDPLTYVVTSDPSTHVTITQDSTNANQFHVAYGDLTEDTNYTFSVFVSDGTSTTSEPTSMLVDSNTLSIEELHTIHEDDKTALEALINSNSTAIATNGNEITTHEADHSNPHEVTATQATYDNTTSGLTATNAQAAIDEIDGRMDTAEAAIAAGNSSTSTVADNLAAHEADHNNPHEVTSTQTTYDNTTSGLTATTAQAAIDEIDGRMDTAEAAIVSNTNAITANASALTAHEADHSNPHAVTATQATYSNTNSGLTATNTQDAIDEVEARVDTNENNITTNISNISTLTLNFNAHEADHSNPHAVTATQATYDNTTSGLTATNTQAAIDEIDGRMDTAEAAIAAGNSNTSTVADNLAAHEADHSNPHEVTSTQATYDNTTSGLTATTAQAAIDEVEGRVDTAETNITTNASNLTTHEADHSNPHAVTATQATYSNATSGLTATNTQAAIDEIDGRMDTAEATIISNTNSITSHLADHNNPHAVTATQATYDNTTSGLTATNTQAAIDEVEGRVDVAETTLVNATLNTDIDVSGNAWVLNENDFASNSATKVPTQASVKAYVDAVQQGLDPKASVRAATPSNIDLTSTSFSGTVDDVTLVNGDRVLLLNQTDATENGIYDAVTATNPSTWTRSIDADTSEKVTFGMYTFIAEGTLYNNKGYFLVTKDTITLGTTALTFSQFTGMGQITAGLGLVKSGDVISIDTTLVVRKTDTDVSGNSWVLNENTLSSNSITKVPTQSSVKTYIDAHKADHNNPHAVTATQATYDNTSSGLVATNTQAAIDEIDGRMDTAETTIASNTSAINSNALALSTHEADHSNPHQVTATQATYDNTTSGLTATNTQAAIDEIDGRMDTAEAAIAAGNSSTSTVAADLATHEADHNNPHAVTATQATYSNTTSGLTATNTQAAIDEVEGRVDVAETILADATLNTDTDVSGNTWVLNENDFASDSATKVPTQASVKAYIDDNTGDITREDLIYYELLSNLSYNNIYYDTFNETGSLDTVDGAIYNKQATKYTGVSGNYIQKKVIDGTDTYYKFTPHVEINSALTYTFAYSIDGGSTWINISNANMDTEIDVSAGFTALDIKFTWSNSGDIYSFGVFYNYITNTSTSPTIFSYVKEQELWSAASNYTAPYILTLPNNMIYNTDGKTLEVYKNGMRLENGVDFTETNNQQVSFTADITAGDKFLFVEKEGYLDTSANNQTRISREHDSIGRHAFVDTATGKTYTIVITNGQLFLEEL